jgi:hypothetical protein
VSGTALVAGGVVQRSGAGGHAWVFAQYVRGCRALGWRVVFVDRAVDAAWDPQQSRAVLELLGGPDGVAVLDATGASVYGLSRPALLAAARQADLLLNVMGYLDDQELLEAVGRRVFLDIDPGSGRCGASSGSPTSSPATTRSSRWRAASRARGSRRAGSRGGRRSRRCSSPTGR